MPPWRPGAAVTPERHAALRHGREVAVVVQLVRAVAGRRLGGGAHLGPLLRLCGPGGSESESESEAGRVHTETSSGVYWTDRADSTETWTG